ncbi:MAG: PQQ-dependent dehydrogenase, methanol/ethanol family [Gemmatimonadales bacterium]
MAGGLGTNLMLLLLPGLLWAQPARPGAAGTDWPHPGRDHALTRFSPLAQISVSNVTGLKAVWTFSTGALRAHEGNPLVLGSVMFVHTPFPNAIHALDLAKPGAPTLWRYAVPGAVARLPMPTGCCDVGSRGLGYHPSGKIIAALLTGDLVALDAATGKELWRARHGDYRTGATTPGAPVIVKDLAIVGTSGAEYGVRGYLAAYDIATGRQVWRGYHTGPDVEILLEGDANQNYSSHRGRDLGISSWPGDEWRRGGATASGPIAYDPDANLIYYGTDHPGSSNPTMRPGDNKWSSAIFARAPETGRVRWILQLTPHDEWGYDASNETILADLKLGSEVVKTLVHFDRNGFVYVIDRLSGKLLNAERFGPANWASRIDVPTGGPIREGRYQTTVATKTVGVCPGAIGAKGLQPAAFSPTTAMFYLPVMNLCMDIQATPATFTPGRPYGGATIRLTRGPGPQLGRVVAWDATTATVAWQTPETLPVTSGVLATAGGLIFYGTIEGWLKALDQRSGLELWRFKTPSGIVGSPITFVGPDGKQYLAVLSGMGGWLGLGGNGLFPNLATITNPGGVLTVFGL